MSELPSGWENVTLGEIALINPRHSTNLDVELAVTFVPMPGISAKDWRFDFTQERKLAEVRQGFTHFAEGDVLFAKITPCMENGKGAIATDLLNGLGFGTTELHVLRPLGNIESKYIFYYLHQKTFRREAERNMTGSAGQLRVPVSFIKDASIPLPPLSEQRRIVAKLEQIFEKLNLVENRLKRVRQLIGETKIGVNLVKLQQSILAKAFRGELTPQDPNDEPASVLLERIRAERDAQSPAPKQKRGPGAKKKPDPPADPKRPPKQVPLF